MRMRRDATTPINYDAPATRPARTINHEYKKLRDEHARAMMREVIAGNVTGQGKDALRGEGGGVL